MSEWLLIVLIASGSGLLPNNITAQRFKTETECRRAEDGRAGRICVQVAPLPTTDR